MMAIPRSVQLKHILYLTDFSRAAESALPFAIGIARAHGSTLHALHVLLAPIQNYPEPVKAGRKFAEGEMKRVEAKLSGVIHETKIAPAINLWQVIDEAIRGHNVDLIVVGTRGRTGPERLFLGSAAEEIFRRSPVPVMTVGPDVKRAERDGQLDRILFATDFTPHSVAALPYAIALSAENRTRLLLVHVLPKRRESGNGRGERREMSVAESFHELHEMVPSDLPLSQSADFAVEFGRPADAIVAAAGQRKASLIVLGIRNAEGHLEAATHLEGGIAHKIVIHAPCPVVTVRG